MAELSPEELENLRRRSDEVASTVDRADPGIRHLLAAHRDVLEQMWCDDPIEALGGLTPRQAAQDPGQREVLRRLIATFETQSAGDITAMRPSQLRALLGLD